MATGRVKQVMAGVKTVGRCKSSNKNHAVMVVVAVVVVVINLQQQHWP